MPCDSAQEVGVLVVDLAYHDPLSPRTVFCRRETFRWPPRLWKRMVQVHEEGVGQPRHGVQLPLAETVQALATELFEQVSHQDGPQVAVPDDRARFVFRCLRQHPLHDRVAGFVKPRDLGLGRQLLSEPDLRWQPGRMGQ